MGSTISPGRGLAVMVACALGACAAPLDEPTGAVAQGVRVGPEVRVVATVDTNPAAQSLVLGREAAGRSSVAAGPSGYLVAWSDKRVGPTGDLHVARVLPDGRVPDVGGIPLTVDDWWGTTNLDIDPQVFWNGASYTVLWSRGRPGAVVARRVSTAGAVLDPAPTATPLRPGCKVALDGADLVAACPVGGASGVTAVELLRLAPADLAVRSRWQQTVTGLPAAATLQGFASAASGYFILFESDDVFGWRVARDGTPRGG